MAHDAVTRGLAVDKRIESFITNECTEDVCVEGFPENVNSLLVGLRRSFAAGDVFVKRRWSLSAIFGQQRRGIPDAVYVPDRGLRKTAYVFEWKIGSYPKKKSVLGYYRTQLKRNMVAVAAGGFSRVMGRVVFLDSGERYPVRGPLVFNSSVLLEKEWLFNLEQRFRKYQARKHLGWRPCPSTFEGVPCGRRVVWDGFCMVHAKRSHAGLPMDAPPRRILKWKAPHFVLLPLPFIGPPKPKKPLWKSPRFYFINTTFKSCRGFFGDERCTGEPRLRAFCTTHYQRLLYECGMDERHPLLHRPKQRVPAPGCCSATLDGVPCPKEVKEKDKRFCAMHEKRRRNLRKRRVAEGSVEYEREMDAATLKKLPTTCVWLWGVEICGKASRQRSGFCNSHGARHKAAIEMGLSEGTQQYVEYMNRPKSSRVFGKRPSGAAEDCRVEGCCGSVTTYKALLLCRTHYDWHRDLLKAGHKEGSPEYIRRMATPIQKRMHVATSTLPIREKLERPQAPLVVPSELLNPYVYFEVDAYEHRI